MGFTDESKVFIVAELSANHNQKFDIAVKTIKAAKQAGADAIKLQTYTPDTMTIDCDNEYFKIKDGLWKDYNFYELYKEAFTPWEWHDELFRIAGEEGLICFSTPFDKTAVEFLEKLNNPIYKISSFEIRDIYLIKYAASKGKPMIISTGIAEPEDIKMAVDICRSVNNNDITLLKCTSAYPAPIEEANLATIPDMKDKFNVKVGVSDHTLGTTVPVIATILGATVVGKHFILNKSLGGPDAAFSLDYHEFSDMVNAIRESEKAIGKVSYNLSNKVKKNKIYGRSIFVIKDIPKGELFNEDNIRIIRPGYGLHPKYFTDILNKKSSTEIKRGTPLTMDMIDFRE